MPRCSGSRQSFGSATSTRRRPILRARHASVPIERHPADKDKTDGDIAADAAIARGAREIVMVGGLGGQADHMLGHFALALRLAQDGIATFLTSGDEEAHPLLPGETRLDLADGTRLSIIALSSIRDLTIEGVRWPLNEPRGAARLDADPLQCRPWPRRHPLRDRLRYGARLPTHRLSPMTLFPTLADVLAARNAIRGIAIETPLIPSPRCRPRPAPRCC